MLLTGLNFEPVQEVLLKRSGYLLQMRNALVMVLNDNVQEGTVKKKQKFLHFKWVIMFVSMLGKKIMSGKFAK